MIISAACGVPMCYTWVSYANQNLVKKRAHHGNGG